MLRSSCVFPILAASLAACGPSPAPFEAPVPAAGGLATAAPGARGAKFDPLPPPRAPGPVQAPDGPPVKAMPPDPFGGALPDDTAEPTPPLSGGVHL